MQNIVDKCFNGYFVKLNSATWTIIFTILVTTFSISINAQTADQIIAQNIKARGGYKKLKAIKTYSSFGTYIEFDAMGKKLYTIEARSDKQLPDKKGASWLAKDLNVEGFANCAELSIGSRGFE